MHGPRPGRVPGSERAALATMGFVLVAVASVLVLHLLRRDVDPVRQVLSEYANGPWGEFMTLAFYTLGAACLALAVAVRGTAPLRAMSALLALAGVGLMVSGVFEVERPLVADTLQETVHSYGSVASFLLLITAMLLLPGACKHDSRWQGFRGPALLLAIAGGVTGASSPLADGTPWTGLAQRLLGIIVVLWLLLTAWRARASEQ